MGEHPTNQGLGKGVVLCNFYVGKNLSVLKTMKNPPRVRRSKLGGFKTKKLPTGPLYFYIGKSQLNLKPYNKPAMNAYRLESCVTILLIASKPNRLTARASVHTLGGNPKDLMKCIRLPAKAASSAITLAKSSAVVLESSRRSRILWDISARFIFFSGTRQVSHIPPSGLKKALGFLVISYRVLSFISEDYKKTLEKNSKFQ